LVPRATPSLLCPHAPCNLTAPTISSALLLYSRFFSFFFLFLSRRPFLSWPSGPFAESPDRLTRPSPDPRQARAELLFRGRGLTASRAQCCSRVKSLRAIRQRNDLYQARDLQANGLLIVIESIYARKFFIVEITVPLDYTL
jgi:hypothetical protein